MLERRVLLVLTELRGADDAAGLLLSAIENAAKPARLMFALPRTLTEGDESGTLTALVGTLPKGDARLYGEQDGLTAALSPRGGATHVLCLAGRYTFVKGWDRLLLRRYALIEQGSALLTGAFGPEDEPECFLPALSGAFFGEGAALQNGLPIVCSASPIRTLLINPAFLFGSIQLMSSLPCDRATLPFTCFMNNIGVYALDRVVAYPALRPRERTLRLPEGRELPGGGLSRFEKRLGASFSQRTIGLRAQWGFFFAENGYPQTLPPDAAFRDALSALDGKRRRLPLIVTAMTELPDAKHPPLYYLARFEYLKNIGGLPLVLYASGGYERSLRARFPETASYPDRGLIPNEAIYGALPPRVRFERGKLPLLKRAIGAYTDRTHAMWLDTDALCHPVCPRARLTLGHLMDDRAHIATVDGVPDASAFVVPRKLMTLFLRKADAINQMDLELRRDMSEESLWLRLMDAFPDLIVAHPMPQRGLLLLTGLDHAVRSSRENALLSAPAKSVQNETEETPDDHE